MKPDINYCLNCKKEVSLRAKYCSDKCTKAFKRNSDKLGQNTAVKSDKTNSDKTNSDKTNSDKTKELSDDLRELRGKLTKTDKTFFDRGVRDFKGNPYYNFDLEKLREDKCAQCKTDFKTNLSLNRYCSYQHYSEAHTAFKASR